MDYERRNHPVSVLSNTDTTITTSSSSPGSHHTRGISSPGSHLSRGISSPGSHHQGSPQTTSVQTPTSASTTGSPADLTTSVSNDLLLALALFQGDSQSADNRVSSITPIQKLLLAQLSANNNKIPTSVSPKPPSLWPAASTGLGSSSVSSKPLLSFLDPVSIALNNAQPKPALSRGGHGRRGRPLGSVGRRKLLENNQETLKVEMRSELMKPATPERDARMEIIQRKIQENEQRLRKLNESKSSVTKSLAGEKRQANTCSMSLVPKSGGVVESPCKQQRLEENKIEPMINMMLNTPRTSSPSLTSSPFLASSFTPTSSPLLAPSFLQPAPRPSLEQLVSSLTSQIRPAPEPAFPALSRPWEAALTLLNRQKMMEVTPTSKCISCCMDLTPSLNIFPSLCGLCTIRRLLPE